MTQCSQLDAKQMNTVIPIKQQQITRKMKVARQELGKLDLFSPTICTLIGGIFFIFSFFSLGSRKLLRIFHFCFVTQLVFLFFIKFCLINLALNMAIYLAFLFSLDLPVFRRCLCKIFPNRKCIFPHVLFTEPNECDSSQGHCKTKIFD